MKYIKIASTDFYNPQNYEAIVKRLDSLTKNATKQWGSMNVSQMLHHLNLAIGSGLGIYQLPDNSNIFTRSLNKFVVLNLLKRFPIGVATAASLKVVDDDYDFDTEKQQLFQILQKAFHTKSDSDWGRHTYFGPMTREEWGKLIMIHCNHHFQQFSS